MKKPMTLTELTAVVKAWDAEHKKPNAHFKTLKKQLYSIVTTKKGKQYLRDELTSKWGIDYMSEVYSLKQYHVYNKIELYTGLGLYLTALNDTKVVDGFGRATYDSEKAKIMVDEVVSKEGVVITNYDGFKPEDFYGKAVSVMHFDGATDVAVVTDDGSSEGNNVQPKAYTAEEYASLQAKTFIPDKNLEIPEDLKEDNAVKSNDDTNTSTL